MIEEKGAMDSRKKLEDDINVLLDAAVAATVTITLDRQAARMLAADLRSVGGVRGPCPDYRETKVCGAL